jgi:hypothetical protein
MSHDRPEVNKGKRTWTKTELKYPFLPCMLFVSSILSQQWEADEYSQCTQSGKRKKNVKNLYAVKLFHK